MSPDSKKSELEGEALVEAIRRTNEDLISLTLSRKTDETARLYVEFIRDWYDKCLDGYLVRRFTIYFLFYSIPLTPPFCRINTFLLHSSLFAVNSHCRHYLKPTWILWHRQRTLSLRLRQIYRYYGENTEKGFPPYLYQTELLFFHGVYVVIMNNNCFSAATRYNCAKGWNNCDAEQENMIAKVLGVCYSAYRRRAVEKMVYMC